MSKRTFGRSRTQLSSLLPSEAFQGNNAPFYPLINNVMKLFKGSRSDGKSILRTRGSVSLIYSRCTHFRKRHVALRRSALRDRRKGRRCGWIRGWMSSFAIFQRSFIISADLTANVRAYTRVFEKNIHLLNHGSQSRGERKREIYN